MKEPATRESVYTHHLRLKPVPPYDFELSAAIFSRGDPQFRNFEDGVFRQALRIDGAVAVVAVRSRGTVEAPALDVEVISNSELSRGELARARKLMTRMFNLDMDLGPFYEHSKGDPVMSRIVARLYGLKSPTTPTVFEALVDSIVEQQISLVAAHSMQNRLIRKFGDSVTLNGEKSYLFPTPERLASASIAGLKGCGLSSRKAEYIKSIAKMVSTGELDLDAFEGYEDIDEIRSELTSIRGIGDWTAEMTMIRGLHKMDSFPADDVGLQAKMTHYYGKPERATSEDLRRIAEKWGSYRGLGGYYMIMAHHVGLEPAGSWPEFWGKSAHSSRKSMPQGRDRVSRR